MDFDEEEAHERLVRSVASLDKKKRPQKEKKKKGKKKKGDSEKDERGVGDELALEDLVGSIDDAKSLGDLKNLLTVSQQRTKVLSAPLHQQAREKVLRGIAYNDTKKTLKEWSGIIRKNRTADQLVFPPEQDKVTLAPVKGIESSFQARSHLEMESARILGKSKHNLTNSEEYTEAEKELMKALSLKEIKARTQEIQKMRHLMSYQEAKAKRQRKIKSKRYHRLLKRQKRREILKEFEDLKERDPEAAKERLELLEKDRIMERAVLKHRGTGQWAKQLRLHARHDEKTRVALNEQLKLGRELKEKVQNEKDDQDEAMETETNSRQKAIRLEDVLARVEDGDIEETLENPDNPWLVSKATKLRSKREKKAQTESITMPNSALPSTSSFVTPRTETVKRKSEQPKSIQQQEDVTILEKQGEEKISTPKSSKKKRKKKSNNTESIDEIFDDLNEKILQTATESVATEDRLDDNDEPRQKIIEPKKTAKEVPVPEIQENENADEPQKLSQFDPGQFMRPQAPISASNGNLIDPEDGDEAREEFLAEAFRDDAVLAEFEAEKGVLVEAEKPKDIDLSMPGWGDWAGSGIDPSKRKRKRLIIKAAPAAPRKDRLLPGVIISEKEDTSIRKLQVSNLPFPFSCVEDFESTIRHPLGPEWNTELGHKSLTEPTVLSRRGRIIQPMDKEAIRRTQKSLDSDLSD